MGVAEDSSEFPWIWDRAEKEAKADVLSFPERMGQPFAIVGLLFLIAFVAIHQTRPTGFFTDEFGTVAAVLLYGQLLAGMPPVIVRFFTGRKNPGRLFEAGGMAVTFVASFYLLVVFPFNFAHFAEPLPGSLEFLIDWVSGTFARLILGFAVLMSAIFSIHNLLLYLAVKKRLSEPELDAHPSKSSEP
ncbi:MAG: hypothetical protein KKE24_04715 [Candidatus Thermoplasmatota archaeon]|nr:hypothetical protein [Candidatus Thermoplasmatota archaeon]